MSTEERLYRHLLRRETYFSRTIPAVILASMLLLAAFGALTWTIWMRADAASVPTVDIAPTAIAVVGGIVAVLGVISLLLAVLPGRRPRRAMMTSRYGLIVDDGALADTTAAAVAQQCGLAPSRVHVTVGTRADVEITPTSGIAVDEEEATRAVAHTLGRMGFALPTRVRVSEAGVIA